MRDLCPGDAEVYPPGGNTVSGNTEIGEFWKGAHGTGAKVAKLDTVGAEPAGDQIIEAGAYTLYGDGNVGLDKGKHIVVWKQDGGS